MSIILLAAAIAACGATPSSPLAHSPSEQEPVILVPRGYRAAILRTTLPARVLEYDEFDLDTKLQDAEIDILAYFGKNAPKHFIPLGDWLVDGVTLAMRDDLGPGSSLVNANDTGSLLVHAAEMTSDDGAPRIATNSRIADLLIANGVGTANPSDSILPDFGSSWLSQFVAMTQSADAVSPLQALQQGSVEFAFLDVEERASLAISFHRSADRIIFFELPGKRVLRLAARKTSAHGARIIGRIREESSRSKDNAYESAVPAPTN